MQSYVKTRNFLPFISLCHILVTFLFKSPCAIIGKIGKKIDLISHPTKDSYQVHQLLLHTEILPYSFLKDNCFIKFTLFSYEAPAFAGYRRQSYITNDVSFFSLRAYARLQRVRITHSKIHCFKR